MNVDELGMYAEVLGLHLPACRRAGVLGREVVEEHVMLRTQAEAAADQSHILNMS